MDSAFLYDMIYALAARDGREKVLFGASAPLAREAFGKSMASAAFPELWFELPLLGEPWFDLHALTSRESLTADDAFKAEQTGGNPDVFRWFAVQDQATVRQLALSWDTGKGKAEHPAVQLLVSCRDIEVTCGFLRAAGRPDAINAYRSFVKSLPHGWFACYAGVFPMRPGHTLRVECIPSRDLQQAYADDPTLLMAHLRQVGLGASMVGDDSTPDAVGASHSAAGGWMAGALGDTIVPRCQLMAKTPFQLEFQFDVEPDGGAGETFGASVRFGRPSCDDRYGPFASDGPAGDFMREVEAWGLSDTRWRELAETSFAMRATRGDESCVLYCYPAFIKLRWHAGEPLDAKAYLVAGLE